MKKKILLTTMLIGVISISSIAYAEDKSITGNEQYKTLHAIQTTEQNANENIKGEFPPSRDFHGKRGHFNDKGNLKKFHPSKAEMEKKKAEIEKRLKLTDEQKQQIETNRKYAHEQVKPIFEQKHAKMQEIRKIHADNTLTQEQKQQKIGEIKAEIKNLNEKANAYRKENMQSFESILTEKQKKEFAKIKEEQKKDMEKRRKKFEEKIKKEGKDNIGFPPPQEIRE